MVVGPLVAVQVGSKAARDALYLSVFDARTLPNVMIASAVLSLLGALVLSRLMPRYGPRRILIGLLAVTSGLFALEGWLLSEWPRAVASLVYLHVATFGALSITSFWSLVSERFDPHAARRLVGRVAAGGALGGLLGGILAERIATWLGPREMLLALASLSGLVTIVAARLEASATGIAASAPEGPASVESSSYLRSVAGLVIVVGILSAVSDYVLKAEASRAMTSVRDLTQFFAVFHTAVSLCTFLVQAGVAQRALQGIGLGGTLAVLPVCMLASGLVAGTLTRLWTAAALKGTESTLSNSLFRSAYELLYTPIGERRRRRAKALIDVGADRVGEILGSGLILGVLTVAAGAASSTVVWLVVVAAGLALWLSLRLNSGYVSELASSLRAGTVRMDPDQAHDMTTRLTVSQTLGAVNRAQLLADIERLRQAAPSSVPSSDTARLDLGGLAASDVTLLRSLVELTCGDPVRAAGELSRPPLDGRLVPQVIALLGDDRTARAARAALRRVASDAAGQLGDALLNAKQPYRVRRRIPAILAAVPSERVVSILLGALVDERFEVRRRSAQALYALVRAHGELRPEPSVLFEAAARELSSWPDPGTRSKPVDRDRMTSELRHVLTLLGLATGFDAVELASRALESNDARLRGTALEYLDNVLPAQLRAQLFERIGAPAGEAHAPRSRTELVEELNRSLAGFSLLPGSQGAESAEEDPEP